MKNNTTLFDLWHSGDVKEAIEDVQIRNEVYGWDVKVPTNREEAIVSFKDVRMVSYVLKETEDRLNKFVIWVEEYETELTNATDIDKKSWLEKEIKSLKRNIDTFKKIIKFINNKT